MFALAPKASSRSRLHTSSTAVKTAEIATCSMKHPPRSFCAVSMSPRPIAMDARGAPPELMSAAKAEMTMMIGRHTPTPVSARLPSPGMWPM